MYEFCMGVNLVWGGRDLYQFSLSSCTWRNCGDEHSHSV